MTGLANRITSQIIEVFEQSVKPGRSREMPHTSRTHCVTWPRKFTDYAPVRARTAFAAFPVKITSRLKAAQRRLNLRRSSPGCKQQRAIPLKRMANICGPVHLRSRPANATVIAERLLRPFFVIVEHQPLVGCPQIPAPERQSYSRDAGRPRDGLSAVRPLRNPLQ